jgi:hypothetical protein
MIWLVPGGTLALSIRLLVSGARLLAMIRVRRAAEGPDERTEDCPGEHCTKQRRVRGHHADKHQSPADARHRYRVLVKAAFSSISSDIGLYPPCTHRGLWHGADYIWRDMAENQTTSSDSDG